MNISELNNLIEAKNREILNLRLTLGIVRDEVLRLREIPFPVSQHQGIKKYWRARQQLAEIEPQLLSGDFKLAGLLADIEVLEKQKRCLRFNDLAFMIRRYLPDNISMEFLINELTLVIEIKENGSED